MGNINSLARFRKEFQLQLFHFLNTKYALDALQDQKLKVSLFDNLNDPFELLAAGTNESATRDILRATKKSMAKSLRLLCCSKSWNEPLLWSHYADKHKGIALILEVPDKEAIHVEYTADRSKIDLTSLLKARDADDVLSISNMLLSTKYKGWKYEDEVRLLFNSGQTEVHDTLEFKNVDNALKITGCILGPLCETDSCEIRNLHTLNIELEIIATKLADHSFEVVRK